MIPKLSESFGIFRKVLETLILRENGYLQFRILVRGVHSAYHLPNGNDVAAPGVLRSK